MDWATWSPFQSPQLREICAHLTPAEKNVAMGRSGLYGLWIAGTVMFPVVLLPMVISVTGGSGGWGTWLGLVRGAMIAVIVALPVLHIACIPAWLRSQRRFLCGTEWARGQGLTPDKLVLFR